MSALQQDYQLFLEGDEDRWNLKLLPRNARMQKLVKRISISGEKNALRSVEILQADGDRSLMTIEGAP
jgi:hypothetical protein